MLEKIKNKKILVGIIIILVLIITCLVLVFTRQSQEQKLTKTLKEMGKDFYENYYYDRTGKSEEERKQAIARFKDRGININLDNLSRYNSVVNEEKIKEFVNKKTGNECDRNNTKIFIYPVEKFDKTDYRVEVVLDCGF